MELIVTDRNGCEEGYIAHRGADFNIGQDNNFEVKIWNTSYDEKKHSKNCRIFVTDTEYGGLIRGVHPITEDKLVKLIGRTWRGILDRIAINPSSNTYIYLDGEANNVIGSLIDNLGISELFSASGENSGIFFDNYQVPLQGMFMTVLTDALEKLNARVDIKYKKGESNGRGHVQLSAVPVVDHSDSIEMSEDGSVKLDILDYQDGINHLICYGKGELEARQRVDLYAWPDGTISKARYYTGIDLVESYFENTNAEDLTELEESGREKFEDLKNYKQLKISVSDMDLELGDIVGGRERITGIRMKAPVVRKIVTITGRGKTTINYKLKGEE